MARSRVTRTVTGAWSGRFGGLVLCHHSVAGVGTASGNPANVCAATLRRHLDALRATARIVRLEDLLRRHREGRSTRGLAALTFDDGYLSLLGEGLPLLRELDAPATVFVTSTASDSGAAFWWDRLADLHPAVAPARWRRFEDELGLPEAYRAGQPTDEGPLRPLRQWLLREFAGRWPEPFEPALSALEAEAGRRTAHRAATWDELAVLARDERIDFGVHTVSHPVLALLPDAEVRREVGDCLATIRERLPRVVPALAIPFGLYDDRTARLAREAGVPTSLTLGGRPWRRGEPDALLPRFSMVEQDGGWRLRLRLSPLRALLRRAAADRPPPLPSPSS